MEFIQENLFKIIITTVVTIVAVIILKLFERNKKKDTSANINSNEIAGYENTNVQTIGNSNSSFVNTTINNFTNFTKDSDNEENNEIEKRKKLTSILFIDDDTKFNIVKILKTEGWENTKNIIDLKSYSDTKLLTSHIIFVDIQGVGKLLECKDEGMGLALNIKNQFPNKKVIIYSAIQSHKVFHDAIKKVDFLLSKDAEPIQFINLVEKFSLEV
jgi:hypothetical protein